MKPYADFLPWLNRIAPILQKHITHVAGRPDTCILSSKIACQIMQAIGIPEARPVAYFVDALNRPLMQNYEAYTQQALTEKDLERLGCYMVGIRPHPVIPYIYDGGVPYHVIAQAENAAGELLMWDLSIEQMSRPHKSLTVKPGAWLFGPADQLPEGIVFSQENAPCPPVYLRYERVPNWQVAQIQDKGFWYNYLDFERRLINGALHAWEKERQLSRPEIIYA